MCQIYSWQPYLLSYNTRLYFWNIFRFSTASVSWAQWGVSVHLGLTSLGVNECRSTLEGSSFTPRNRPAPQYMSGQKVWLSSKDIPSKSMSKKLSPQFIGPYEIEIVVSPTVIKLKLLASFRIHPVVHVFQVKLVFSSPLWDGTGWPLGGIRWGGNENILPGGDVEIFSWHSMGSLTTTEHHFNATAYILLLLTTCMTTVHTSSHASFQQDNKSYHKAQTLLNLNHIKWR